MKKLIFSEIKKVFLHGKSIDLNIYVKSNAVLFKMYLFNKQTIFRLALLVLLIVLAFEHLNMLCMMLYHYNGLFINQCKEKSFIKDFL